MSRDATVAQVRAVYRQLPSTKDGPCSDFPLLADWRAIALGPVQGASHTPPHPTCFFPPSVSFFSHPLVPPGRCNCMHALHCIPFPTGCPSLVPGYRVTWHTILGSSCPPSTLPAHLSPSLISSHPVLFLPWPFLLHFCWISSSVQTLSSSSSLPTTTGLLSSTRNIRLRPCVDLSHLQIQGFNYGSQSTSRASEAISAHCIVLRVALVSSSDVDTVFLDLTLFGPGRTRL